MRVSESDIYSPPKILEAGLNNLRELQVKVEKCFASCANRYSGNLRVGATGDTLLDEQDNLKAPLLASFRPFN